MQQTEKSDFWKITLEERTKHDNSFNQLNPLSGFLTGEQAREFFLKSNLPTLVLGQIWNLADLNKDGKLDKREFSIACSLIKKVLTNGEKILPATLPPTMLIDPTVNTSLGSSTPLTTPIQPLFPASFPAANLSSTSSNSMSSSNILPSLFPTTTTTSAPSLAGGGIRMPMTSSVPAASTSTSNLGSIPGTLNMPLFNTTPAFPLLPVTPIAPITSPTQIVSNTTTTPLVGVMPSMMPTSAPPLVAAGSVAPKVNPTLIPGAVVTPIASLNNSPLFPISSTSRTKYTQMFQTNDQTLSGFVSGQQAKTILLQTGLAQTVLAQVWNLADFDKDGKLTLEEFIIAMHLCDYSKSVGNILPSVLPVELHPQRIRAASTTNMLTTSSNGASLLASTSLPATPTPLSAENSSIDTSPTSLAKPQASLATTFEEKRRDNFNRGNQVLEAKRQMLRDAEEREKREREEKERLEQERKQKLKEEQERKRLAEIEKQMERQRLLDMQREEERRKAFEQREQARNELLRQQRIEWERQKKQELELQKLKLQEQLSTLKAKDKNLEYDMQTLNEKIASYKTKINDNQQTLNELNNRLDATRKSYLLKQSEVEIKEKELKEYTQNMSRFSQEKLYLSEQQNGLKIDNPFAEEYRNDMAALKSKQALVSQLKTDLERMESQINTTRTQLEMFKHELEVNKADEREIIKENSRLETLLDLKRGTVMPPNGTNGINHKNSFNKSDSVSNISAMQNGTTHHQAFKTSLSSNNIRSNTPMNNYDVFKSEIEKIQKSTQQLNGANTIKPFDSPSKQQQVSFDPFSSGNNNTKTNAGFGDDWAAFDTNTNTSNGFGSDPFAAFGAGTASVDPFASTSSVTKSLSVNGFGTSDNWAASFTTANDNNSNFNAAPAANLTNSPSSNSITNTVNNNNVAFTNTNENNNWNAFDDAPFGGVQSVHQSPMSSPSSTGMKPLNQLTKYRAEFQFDATRDDELSIKPGDLITVDATFKTDEGWLWGECQGRTGVFPAGFAVKMNDLTSIQEEIHHDFATNAFANNFFPPQTTLQQQPPQPVQQHQPVQKMISSGSSHSFNQTPVQTTTNQISNIKNYYISLYSYTSNEPGDLMFKEFEIINVIDKNEDWLTGQIVGSGSGPGNPLRTGIFPSNFVIKFNFPIEYIGKYTIAMATEVYQAQTGDQLTLNPSDSQLIAIKKLSPDQKWSYGESYDFNGKLVKGWFPVQSAMPLIDAGAVPLYVPPSSGPNTPSGSVTTPTNSESSSSSSPPPPTFSAHNKANNTTSLLAEDPFASSASNINIVLPTTSIINSKSALNDKQLIVESNVNTNSINSNASSSTKPSSANSQSASANTNSGSAASTPTGLTKTVSNTQIKQKHQAASSTLSSSTTSTPSNTAASAAVASSTAASNAATSTQAAPTNTETASAASPAQAPVTNPKIPNNYVDQVIALYDFQSTTPETIGFQKDSIINIIEKSGDWWLGELNGKIGLLPYNYVQSLSKGNERLSLTDIETTESTYNSKDRNSLTRQSIQTDYESDNLSTNTPNNYYINNNINFDEFNQENTTNHNPNNNNKNDSDFDNSFDDFDEVEDTTATTQEEFNETNMTQSGSKLDMRSNVINEILQTEKSYLKNLRNIIEWFKKPLEHNKILTPSELETIFINLEEIIPVNSRFLNALNKRIDEARQNNQTPRIGDIFNEHLPKMKIYSKYVSGQRFGENLIHEKMKSSPEFSNIITKTITGDTGDFIFKKLLLIPMQRLPQYSLLIEKLIKYVPENNEDYQLLKSAHQLTKDLIKYFDSEVGRKDDLERLEWLEEHINVKGLGFKFNSQTNLMGQRALFYYGPLVKESGKEKDLYGFLFNDLFLLVEANESLQNGIFKPIKTGKFPQIQMFKQPVLLDRITSVQSKLGQPGSDCSFQLVFADFGDKEYSFKTTNPTLRNEWIKQIQKAIEAYKQKKRSIRNSISNVSISQKSAIGRFLLVIMEAQDLLMTDSLEKKAFCEAEMGFQKFNTHIIESLNPKWNTSMQFQIYDLNKDVLSVSVYDSKTFSPNVFLGKTELRVIQIYREQLKETNNENGPVPITKVFRMSNVPSGKIMLKMSISIFNR